MDVEAGAGAGWSGAEWEPVGAVARQSELEVLRVEREIARCYPALTRVLGQREVEALSRELVAAHPFLPGTNTELPELLSDFLGVALEDDKRRGAWLSELARLEEAFEAVRLAPRGDADVELGGGQLLACEHRVHELREELRAGGAWNEPAPQPVLLAVFGGSEGPRCVELSREEWSTAATLSPQGFLGRAPRAALPHPQPRSPSVA